MVLHKDTRERENLKVEDYNSETEERLENLMKKRKKSSHCRVKNLIPTPHPVLEITITKSFFDSSSTPRKNKN